MGHPSLLDLMGDTGQKPKPLSDEITYEKQGTGFDSGASGHELQGRKTEHCELELVLHYDNEVKAAIQVSITGDTNKAVWLPKSQIEFRQAGRNAPATTTAGNPVPSGLPVIVCNVPEWLAKDRGLI